MNEVVQQRKPKWLRVKLPTGENYKHVRKLVSEHKLHTICESGNCPNMGECWGEGTATFMILGKFVRVRVVFVRCNRRPFLLIGKSQKKWQNLFV